MMSGDDIEEAGAEVRPNAAFVFAWPSVLARRVTATIDEFIRTKLDT
jgi:hypothetical protein